MIVADTSAIIAVQLAEPERPLFVETMKDAGKVLVSSVSVVEAQMVMYGRRGHPGVLSLDRFLNDPLFEIVPPGPEETQAAYEAFVSYGKRNGHPASLNFGDLFAYALAKTRNLPLLFKGDDFPQTDIVAAWQS
ncbi:type II toxin-antitoxin system VapC family toxin [Chelativorans sp. AA-79]|uniref:type II toxin-antitoxin system VapC family toxin n=1 Tax=Chelativorans sp. AA-79 TaxID=3028735 RepID=UPI0023F972F7|nr:type II toxin-antitoxin system VapC family toxin [Chelativorans sp. AA-79]WEX07797.1 type II toxin-antitoxin system VapC family toxin [Chelativorans sp. AA-79]